MKRIGTIYLVISLIACSLSAMAEVRLPAIISNHMVLQSKSKVNLWGWADTGEKITISTSWDTVTYKTITPNTAKWILPIKTPAVGGPYTITIKGSNTLIIEDILIGEVWDCSGQSNMEMSYSWGIGEYKSIVDNSLNNNIRFFHIPRLTSNYPQDDTKGKWEVCSPESLRNFSMVGYFFGKRLNEMLKCPVGLINASWGGTPAEAWTPATALDTMADLKAAAAKLEQGKPWPTTSSVIFNAEINPIVNFAIAGVIWYQGESNVGNPGTYSKLLSTMIYAWRKAWQKEIPFYIVQIAPYSGYGNGISSALLREQQAKAANLSKTGIVVIHDLVSDIKDIHPKNKMDVGLRLANLALNDTYGKTDIAAKSPQFKSWTIKNSKAVVDFTNINQGLVSKGGNLTDFYIAGEDKVFFPANAKISGKQVVVWNETIKNPVAVRFGFTNTSMPNLYSREGLPVAIFRTDTWDDVATIR